MTGCNLYDEGALRSYLDPDNPLSEQEREQVAAHLATCPGCRARLDDLCHIIEKASAVLAGYASASDPHLALARFRRELQPAVAASAARPAAATTIALNSPVARSVAGTGRPRVAVSVRPAWVGIGLAAAMLLALALSMLLAGNVTRLAGSQQINNPDLTVAARTSPSPTPQPSGTADEWTLLRRRLLNLPVVAPGAKCPVGSATQVVPNLPPQLGSGPVYATEPYFEVDTGDNPATRGWYSSKIIWVGRGDFRGPVLVRGRKLDGAGIVQLQHNGNDPVEDELRLDASNMNNADSWASAAYVQSPGCYSFQVDTENWTDVIIFQVEGTDQASVTPEPTATLDDWTLLGQRPVSLPTIAPGGQCPVSKGATHVLPNLPTSLEFGQGPIYLDASTADGRNFPAPNGVIGLVPSAINGITAYHFYGPWVGAPEYTGPVLARGRQLDGEGQVRFDYNLKHMQEQMRLDNYNDVSGTNWRFWPSTIIVPNTGCYAFQVDGENFSYSVTLQVVHR